MDDVRIHRAVAGYVDAQNLQGCDVAYHYWPHAGDRMDLCDRALTDRFESRVGESVIVHVLNVRAAGLGRDAENVEWMNEIGCFS